MQTFAELAVACWWRLRQAERGIRGSCCTTAIAFRALTVVDVRSDSCMVEKTGNCRTMDDGNEGDVADGDG
jgi:hypothetical protein